MKSSAPSASPHHLRKKTAFLLYALAAALSLAGILSGIFYLRMRAQFLDNRNEYGSYVSKRLIRIHSNLTQALAEDFFWEKRYTAPSGQDIPLLQKRLSYIKQHTYALDQLYLIYEDGTLILPDGQTNGAGMLPSFPTDTDHIFLTSPYWRPADGEFVITYYRFLDDAWTLAADVRLDTLFARISQPEKDESFFCLFYEGTGQVLFHPDTRFLGQKLEDTKDPLLTALSTAPILSLYRPKKTEHAKDKEGQRYQFAVSDGYRASLQVPSWNFAYFQSDASLMRDVFSKENVRQIWNLWPVFFIYLLLAALSGLLVWLHTRQTDAGKPTHPPYPHT